MKAKIQYSLFVLIFLIAPLVGYSQNSCGQSTLDNAQFNYNVGRFEQVSIELNECLESGAFNGAKDKTLKEDALRLLAMNAIATDSVELAREYVKSLIEHNPNYNSRTKDPLLLNNLISDYKNQDFGIKVISASKFEEPLEKAPAPMLVITAEDIKNRGYLDIEQIFHDIPGFSVVRGNGPGYATIYPRGYRSTSNDRFLLLIDGIEENDLNSDNAVTNRQTPLTNIKQIEVIYGPASTMYGVNAYAAVINIITKDKDDLFPNNSTFTGDIQANYGSFNTRFIDANLNKKFKEGYFSLTTRLLKSDEMDLSDRGYGYEANSADQFIAEGTNLSGMEASSFFNNQLGGNSHRYFNYSTAGDTSLSLSNAGANQMVNLDKTFYDDYEGYRNDVRNWYLYGKLRFKGFTLGVESFRNNNGATPWYPEDAGISGKDISRWITWNTFIYFKYNKQINENLTFTSFSSYRLHTIDGNSNLSNVNSYTNGKMNFDSLLLDRQASISYLYFFRTSNQLRNETKIFYQPNKKFNLISGIELRSGIIQGAYLTSSIPNPNEHSAVPDSATYIPGGNVSNTYDVGTYTQARYSFTKNLSATLGGRLDYNQIKTNGGYGFVFNPRIALIYSRDKYVLKTIYSEAFKDASFLQKFSIDPTTNRNITNPGLLPEKVKNLEVGAFYKFSKSLNADLTAYYASYSDVVGIAKVQLDTGISNQYQAIGELEIYGLQASIKFSHKNLTAWLNYSFTHPYNNEIRDVDNDVIPDSTARISDIPSHSFNLIVNYRFLEKYNINVRSNYVGERETGRITSPSSNPATVFPSYFVVHANLNYKVNKDLTIGLLINNVLDEVYYHPGIRGSDGISESSSFLQNERSFMLRANYTF